MNLRSGKAGFVGAVKYWVKGIFNYHYSVTSTDVVQEPTETILISNVGRTLSINDKGRTVKMPE